MISIRSSKLVTSLLVLTLLTAGLLVIQAVGNRADALPQAPGMAVSGASKALIDPADTVILLLDHQSGLFQTVKDISVAELRTNTVILAKVARLMKIPVITTASEPNGPNGPLMPEIHQNAPDAIYVPRKGEISAWDNARWLGLEPAGLHRASITADCQLFAGRFILRILRDEITPEADLVSLKEGERKSR